MGAVLLASAVAYACVSGASVNLSTVNAAPGQEVSYTGTGFRSGSGPVEVRMDSLEGTLLDTAEVENRNAIGSFTVPQNTAPGNHVVLFTRVDNGQITVNPVRALLIVTPDGGAAPALSAPLGQDGTARPLGLEVADESLSTGSMVLIGLGVAGVGMFMAGMAALVAGRKAREPETAKARS